MSRRPAVSVVISVFDSMRYLPETVDSVFNQTLGEWELLLVDGGSTDGGRAWAKAMQKRHPGKVRAILPPPRPRLGILQAWILGAKEAQAPLVALLDSDDEWNPRLLERHHAAYRRAFGRGRGLVYCPAVFWWEDARLGRMDSPSPGVYQPPSLLPEFLERDYAKTPCGTGTLLDRRILIEAERFSASVGPHMVHDQYLWSHAALNYPICVSRELLFWYRRRSDSVCARGEARGVLQRLRRRHLRWLMGHILESRFS